MQQAFPISFDTDARERGGGAKTILFLHDENGLAGADAFLDALSRKARVLAPVLPGFDGTPVPAWLDDMQDLAFYMREWLRVQDLSQVHVVGQSLGGWLAAEIAMLDAARLASLTLVAPGGLRHPDLRMFDVFMAATPDVARMSVHNDALADRLAREAADPERADGNLQNRFMTARLAWQPRFYSPRLEKWLHRVDLRAQIIWGAQDRIMPPGFAESYAARLKHARTHVLSACGHMPVVEQPQAVAELVLSLAQDAAS